LVHLEKDLTKVKGLVKNILLSIKVFSQTRTIVGIVNSGEKETKETLCEERLSRYK